MKAKAAKKKYKPKILNSFKYRGFKINEVLNRKTNRHEFKVRFQMGNKEFYLTDDRRKNLESTIDETLAQMRRAHYNLPTAKYFPDVRELFDLHTARLEKNGNRKQGNRFAAAALLFLSLVPEGIKLNELKPAHFQKFIDLRLAETNARSGKPVLPETVNKDIWALSAAISDAPLYFAPLDSENLPALKIPKAKEKKNRRRERLVKTGNELAPLLEYLRRPHKSERSAAARRRIADDLEIRYETGFRRIEVARLKKMQYEPSESALRNVKRFKTGTVTKFFPLSRRAASIIEHRISESDSDSEYIFTEKGKPNESAYKIISEACEILEINYGAFSDGGFVPHDLRRNFATRVIKHADVKTVAELLGHSSTTHTQVYLQTDEKRLKEAVSKCDGADYDTELKDIFDGIKNDIITFGEFLRRIKR